ncbi:hypothetical protein IAR55_002667 [Kwoniella newhampshirensis]|uniref:Rho-GAP domain-containing protein n=1 Tax=Kwoniella newhampshirensis TaxID=1651941 RepID=A0AAW0YXH5_9TREE
MSSSRIPRPGAAGIHPPGGMTSSPIATTGNRSNPSSSALGTISIKANNPFAQMHNKHVHSGSPVQGGFPTTGNGANRVPHSQATVVAKRRPKPPSPDLDESHGLSPTVSAVRAGTGIQRRPVPPATDYSSTLSKAGGMRGPTMTEGQGQRSILRQPSTPVLGSADRDRRFVGGVATSRRPRAASSVSSHNTNTPIIISSTQADQAEAQAQGGGTLRPSPSHGQHLFEPSFAEHREPAVPPHIRARLRLIHQLGVVLGIDAVGISGKIDIPGLLARVDQAYDRERGGGQGGGGGVRGGGMSALPVLSGGNVVPTTTVSSSGVQQKGGISGGGGGGVFGMFRRLGRKSTGEEMIGLGQQDYVPPSRAAEGPAFGVSLSDAPPGSWCTSLIGGQRHELPLVVFTVVEEIYRRGMSQPGIFRLAGDGTRISHLTKAFNLPPLFGDSLPISCEPIHNLTGLVKRYVRDLPEPLLDESLFPAFLAFCVSNDETGLNMGDEGSQTSRNEHDEGHDTISNKDPTDSLKQTDRPGALPLATRITAAQILLRLLPPLHFSLFIYLLAFLGQLPLFPDNRLNIESISIIFGPAMCAARGKGISGLGPTVTSTRTRAAGGGFDAEEVSDLVGESQGVLSWLLKNWSEISERVLDEDDLITGVSAPEEIERDTGREKGHGGLVKGRKASAANLATIDPRLLSPIDLRGSGNERRARRPDKTGGVISISNPSNTVATAGDSTPTIIHSMSIPTVTPLLIDSSPISRNSSASSTSTAVSDPSPTSTFVSSPFSTSVSHSALKTSPSSGGGLFARAFSSMSISSQAEDKDNNANGGVAKVAKRSASFNSLSSLVKKVGNVSSSVKMPSSRSISDDHDLARPSVNPQITTVLGSLHDLLVSKDKQIERDARELALLRHTLLEMDEKLHRVTPSSPLPGPVGLNGCTCPIHPNSTFRPPLAGGSETPEITITSTPSSKTLPTSISTSTGLNNRTDADIESLVTQVKAQEMAIYDLQSQLSTSLAGLESSRMTTRSQAERVLVLEGKLARNDGEKRLEVGRLEVALALEQARCVGLVEERDLARDRLEKVKTTLFSVA